MKKDWNRSMLEDVLDIIRNGINCKQDKNGNENKISRIESISTARFDTNRVGYSKLSEAEKEKYKLLRGDILFSHINSPIHVGKTAIFDSDEEVYHGVNLLLLRPKSILQNEYLDQYLKFLFQSGYWLSVCKQSVNQASVNQQDILKIEINFPKSITEQKRIVAILDKAFSAIDKAKANIEKNLENVRELWESYLEINFATKGKGWKENTVRQFIEEGIICKPLDGNHGEIHPLKTDYVEFGVPFLMSRDLSNGVVDLINCKFIGEKLARSLRTGFAKNNDVLLSHKGTIGSVAVLNTTYENVILTPQITYYRVKDSSKLLNRFLYYYFLTPRFQRELKNIAEGGSTRAYIGITRQLELPLIIAPLPVQHEIVNTLDNISTQLNKLSELYSKKIIELKELKKSILQKIFKGNLKA